MSPAHDTALRLQSVSKQFGTTQALRNVSLEIPAGRIHALLGGNGSGKSTLIKILAGVETANHGSATVGASTHDLSNPSPNWAKDAGLRFVHQDLGLFLDLTAAENICLTTGYSRRKGGSVSWSKVNRDSERILQKWKIAARPTDVMADLRPADRTMIAIARTLSADEPSDDTGAERSRILILDEPTSALPDVEVDSLLEWLRHTATQGNTVVIVTHRLEEVLAVADSITVLRDGEHVTTEPRSGLTRRDLVRFIAPSATQSRKNRTGDVQRATEAAATSVPRLEVRHITGKSLGDVNFTVRSGEVVGIAGLLGSGRTRLLKYLAGVLRPDSGQILLDGMPVVTWPGHKAIRSGIVLVPESRADDGLFPGMTIAENLEAGSLAIQSAFRVDSRRGVCERAKDKARRFGVKASSVSADILTLSGGNQQKVLMARWLSASPRLILLDEPTVGVDIGARKALHNLVKDAADAGSAALCVSSDLNELCELCDRVLVLHQGVITESFAGDDLSAHEIGQAVHGTLEARP